MNTTAGNNRLSIARVWWLHPTALVFAFLLPLYLLVWILGELTAGTLSTSRAFFYLTGQIAWLGLIGILVLGIGTLSPIRPRNAFGRESALNTHILTLLGVLTLLGYAYWFKDFILRPNTIWAAIKAGSSVTFAIRGSIDRYAGIASLAQLGLPFLIGYTYLIWAAGAQPNVVQRWIFRIVILAILFRVFGWAERIALIEAAIALCFVWAAFRAQLTHGLKARLLPYTPVVGGACLVGLFAISEYLRSWTAYYYKIHGSFWEFITQRLINYYFNALNTGAGRLVSFDWPTWDFEATLRWLHKMPFFGRIFTYLVGGIEQSYSEFLYRFGDPEYNNPSGLFSIYYDIGVPWGLVLLLLLGALSKYFYSFWYYGKSFTGSMYFLFLMTVLELFRYLYIGDSRCFMVAAGLLLLIVTTKGFWRESPSSHIVRTISSGGLRRGSNHYARSQPSTYRDYRSRLAK
jgi:hypothetical protein